MLLCPFCQKLDGKTEPVETPKHSVFIPAMFDRWIPRWAQGKFSSLEDAVRLRPEFRALIIERGKRKEAAQICRRHIDVLKAAEPKVWTSSLVQIEEFRAKVAESRSNRALGTIASLLEPVEISAAKKVGEKTDKRNAKTEEIQADPAPELQLPEVVVEKSTKPRKVKVKKSLVQEGKGLKPRSRKDAVEEGKGGQGKNLARSGQDEI